MLEQRNYLKALKRLVLSSLILSALLLSSGCSYFKFKNPLKTIEIKTVEVERVIPTQNRPRPVDLNDIYFYVVTEQNFEEFKNRFVKENGDLVGYVLSVRDYETLALNMAEIKRYLQQQKEIIIYYEKAVAPKPKKEEKKK
jgi:hypothetical protein